VFVLKLFCKVQIKFAWFVASVLFYNIKVSKNENQVAYFTLSLCARMHVCVCTSIDTCEGVWFLAALDLAAQ
jgi:hypothetical protein